MTTIEEGLVDGQTLKLTTKDVARMSFANDVAVTKVTEIQARSECGSFAIIKIKTFYSQKNLQY